MRRIYQAGRDCHDLIARKWASRARGEKLQSQIPSSMMRCVCGARFDGCKPAESYNHRRHIYAALAKAGYGEPRSYLTDLPTSYAVRISIQTCGSSCRCSYRADFGQGTASRRNARNFEAIAALARPAALLDLILH